jgi:hypothetical protein
MQLLQPIDGGADNGVAGFDPAVIAIHRATGGQRRSAA